ARFEHRAGTDRAAVPEHVVFPDQGAVSGLYARAQYRARVDDRAGPDAAVRADDGRMLTGLRAPRRYPDPGARLDNGTLVELYAREDVRLVGHQANLPAWSNGCTGATPRQRPGPAGGRTRAQLHRQRPDRRRTGPPRGRGRQPAHGGPHRTGRTRDGNKESQKG